MKLVSFTLKPVAPFRLDYTAWALRRRPDNIVDRWEDGQYRRVFAINGKALAVSAVQGGSAARPVIEVNVAGDRISAPSIKRINLLLSKMLGLCLDLSGFYSLSKKDRRLDALAGEFMGLKPPRFENLYEAMVNAVACQQLSLLVGIRLLNRMAQAYGKAFRGGAQPAYSFPSPEALAEAQPAELRALGFSAHKADSLVEISRAVASRRPGNSSPDLEAVSGMENEEAGKQLTGFRGIGRWSAQYALLRGLGRMDVFPGDDVGARHKLRNWMGIGTPLAYEDVERIVSRWQPYGGFIYFHLLLKSLKAKGYLDSGVPVAAVEETA